MIVNWYLFHENVFFFVLAIIIMNSGLVLDQSLNSVCALMSLDFRFRLVLAKIVNWLDKVWNWYKSYNGWCKWNCRETVLRCELLWTCASVKNFILVDEIGVSCRKLNFIQLLTPAARQTFSVRYISSGLKLQLGTNHVRGGGHSGVLYHRHDSYYLWKVTSL